MKDLNNDTYYWVKTDGYLTKHTAIYRNANGQWRISIDDKVLFISDYKLSLLYGKDCVVRELKEEYDILKIKEGTSLPDYFMDTDKGLELYLKILNEYKNNKYIQMAMYSDKGSLSVVNYYPAVRAFDITYGLVPLGENETVFKDYGMVFYNPLF